MSASILDDPRVTRFGDSGGYEVTTDGGDMFRVLPNEAMGWGIYYGPNLDLLITQSGPAIGIGSAEEAIGALLP